MADHFLGNHQAFRSDDIADKGPAEVMPTEWFQFLPPRPAFPEQLNESFVVVLESPFSRYHLSVVQL